MMAINECIALYPPRLQSMMFEHVFSIMMPASGLASRRLLTDTNAKVVGLDSDPHLLLLPDFPVPLCFRVGLFALQEPSGELTAVALFADDPSARVQDLAETVVGQIARRLDACEGQDEVEVAFRPQELVGTNERGAWRGGAAQKGCEEW